MAKKLAPVAYDTLLGQPVRVFRNLHNGLFSVQCRGIVVAHLPEVHLENVRFTVQPAGRARVLATGHKCVHAFVCGTVVAPAATGLHRATYNPRKAPGFVLAGPLGEVPVSGCDRATVNATGVWL